MQVTFQFLGQGSRFTANLPSGIDALADLSTIVYFNDSPRTIQYRPLGAAATIFAGQIHTQDIQGTSGIVALYDMVGDESMTDSFNPLPVSADEAADAANAASLDPTEPPPVLLYWALSTGYVWTHANRTDDGMSGINELAQGLIAQVSGGYPRVTLTSPLAGGDPGEPDEQDAAVFPSVTTGGVPWSVQFRYAGSWAANSGTVDTGVGMVSRKATGTGASAVEVVCEGPESYYFSGQLGSIADSIAASVAAA